jgi:hypothetical protein
MLEARKTIARIYASSREPSKALDLLLQAPNPEGEWEEDYYVLLVSCALAAERPRETLKFCESGASRFPSSERLTAACAAVRRTPTR